MSTKPQSSKQASVIDMTEDTGQSLIVSRREAEQAISRGRPIGEILFSGEMQLAPIEVQQIVLAEYDKRRSHFMDWLLGHMVEGVHYGIPPGCEQRTNSKGEPVDRKGNRISEKQWQAKPTLYKAGAQLLVDLLQFSDHYEVDRDIWEMMGSTKGSVCMTCSLSRRTNGVVVALGHGTMESGEKSMGVNARVKIAKKRALVDAVLLAVPGLSDLFTQDLEDDTSARDTPTDRPTNQNLHPNPATQKQVARLWSLSEDERLDQHARDWLKEVLADAANRLNVDSANKCIYRAKLAIEQKTGKPYTPPEDEDDSIRQPGDDAEEDGPDLIPEFPDAAPEPVQESLHDVMERAARARRRADAGEQP